MPDYSYFNSSNITLYSLGMYIVNALIFYFLAKKGNIRNPWLAFIPLVQFILFLHIINKSGWNILLMLIPIANLVIAIIWYVKFFNAFGMSGAWVLLMFIPFGIFIIMLYMAFSESVQYTLPDNQYTE
jgi:hypothetical protein